MRERDKRNKSHQFFVLFCYLYNKTHDIARIRERKENTKTTITVYIWSKIEKENKNLIFCSFYVTDFLIRFLINKYW